ncbi:MAG: LytTR family DNA-binding domain-containing protein, partial [Bacteroidota bacterium]
YLADHPEIEVLQECNDGFEGLKSIQQHKPDLIFLDVQMPKISGFEMLELVDYPVEVIFTTAFDEYAIKAFESNAVDYLLKPFSKERFDKAIRKWTASRRDEEKPASLPSTAVSMLPVPDNHRIVVKKGSDIRIIPVGDILYLEAYDDYVKIHAKDEVYLKKKTMSHFEQQLDPNEFVRVHRSYLLQVSQITKLEPMEKDSYVAVLRNGTKIPISKTGYPRLRTVLGM